MGQAGMAWRGVVNSYFHGNGFGANSRHIGGGGAGGGAFGGRGGGDAGVDSGGSDVGAGLSAGRVEAGCGECAGLP